jgi:uncharacterized protein GlcG (DUF336 family)
MWARVGHYWLRSRHHKAVTARIFDEPTSLLAELAQPGAPLFGIPEAHSGRVVNFGGGLPVTSP